MKRRTSRVLEMIKTIVGRRGSAEEFEVIWNGTKAIDKPFTPRPDKPETFLPKFYDRHYWRRRKEILKQLEE